MSIKGFLSNYWRKKVTVGSPELAVVEADKQQYASLSLQGDLIYGLRTTPKGVGLVNLSVSIDALDPLLILSKDALPITAHALKLGDHIRMTSGALLGEEAQVVDASDLNWVVVVGLSAAPALSDTFAQLRPITQTFDLNGNTFVTEAPKTVVDTMDTPFMIPTGVNAIPAAGGAFLEIVAVTAFNISELMMIHDMGEPVNLFIGAAASEIFLCHLPLTPDEKVTVSIPVGSRLSLQAAKPTPVDDATSFIEMNFIG